MQRLTGRATATSRWISIKTHAVCDLVNIASKMQTTYTEHEQHGGKLVQKRGIKVSKVSLGERIGEVEIESELTETA